MRTLVFTVFLVALVTVAPADACSCAGPGAPCEAAWRADVVFVGHVVSIDRSTTSRHPVLGGRRVELAVVEAFRGLQLSQVSLLTGSGGADCGYPFKMGESYVVYAHRSPDGQLSASICSRTRPVSDATEDLTYLRSLAAIRPGTPARLSGRVELWEYPRPPKSQLKPVAGVTVTATGESRTFSAKTNDRGEFDLKGLPLGKYELKANAPDGYDSIAHTVEINDPRGCGTTTLYTRYDGGVLGRVVDRNGVGIRGLLVGLVPTADVNKTEVSSGRVQAWTAADGTFELRLVPPGDYLLEFHSIRGTKVVLAAGERVRLPNFVVPERLSLVMVNGIVIDEAERPVRDATVVLRDNTEGPNIIGPRVVTAEDGGFAFALVEGAKYDVHVTSYLGTDPQTREMQVSIVRFTAAPGAPVVRVVMKPSRYQ